MSNRLLQVSAAIVAVLVAAHSFVPTARTHQLISTAPLRRMRA